MITACRVTSPFGAKLSVTTSHATASRAADPSGSANSVTRVSHLSGRKRLAYLSGHKRVAFALYGNAGLFKHEPFEFHEERATGSLHALLFFWRVLLLSLRVSRDVLPGRVVIDSLGTARLSVSGRESLPGASPIHTFIAQGRGEIRT